MTWRIAIIQALVDKKQAHACDPRVQSSLLLSSLSPSFSEVGRMLFQVVRSSRVVDGPQVNLQVDARST
ncbi:hypothetical protein FIBSPDRAFT_859774 [Athelia psychrophila]|uniref:Uncharacterized protein n=1 Tax=Athelia psychrophila TaxID=1759441 RepID=A0A166KRU0_9AGAM|nr:hypothetical protein FIBSPDRAFT_859774 [Fibularhizoctonia sp. CBS 109695]